MRLSTASPLSALDLFCMVEIAKGTRPKQAFLKCPESTLGGLSFQAFSEHWWKARQMRVDVDLSPRPKGAP